MKRSSLRRWLIGLSCLLASVTGSTALAADSTAAAGPATPTCEWTTLGGDHRDFKCPLVASGSPQRFRLVARFSGGHDDTSAQLSATLDGQPLACTDGSKTSLFGEDGDVSLNCGLTLTGESGTPHVFGVRLLWSHAHYEGFSFEAE